MSHAPVAWLLWLSVLFMLLACAGLSAQSSFPEQPLPPKAPESSGGFVEPHAGFADSRCETGAGYFVPGCGASSRKWFPAGCYRACDRGEAACPAHQVCRAVLIDPCHGKLCMACGATRSLCLDRP